MNPFLAGSRRCAPAIGVIAGGGAGAMPDMAASLRGASQGQVSAWRLSLAKNSVVKVSVYQCNKKSIVDYSFAGSKVRAMTTGCHL